MKKYLLLCALACGLAVTSISEVKAIEPGSIVMSGLLVGPASCYLGGRSIYSLFSEDIEFTSNFILLTKTVVLTLSILGIALFGASFLVLSVTSIANYGAAAVFGIFATFGLIIAGVIVLVDSFVVSIRNFIFTARKEKKNQKKFYV